MDTSSRFLLRSLLLGRSTAALATLHDGEPFASMVPVAATLATGRLVFVTHVSGLAAHTRDMRSHPRVCLLFTAGESEETSPQALPRVSIPAMAEFVSRDAPEHDLLAAAYLGKFPDAAPLFGFADFSLVALVPESARFVAGFARAMTLTPEMLQSACAAPEDDFER